MEIIILNLNKIIRVNLWKWSISYDTMEESNVMR